MSVHVLLNLLNELGKAIKFEACRAFYPLFRNEFNKMIMQEHEFIIWY